MTLLDSDMKDAENDSSFDSSDDTKDQSGRIYEKDAVDKISDYVIILRKKMGQESKQEDKNRVLLKHKERKYQKFLA